MRSIEFFAAITQSTPPQLNVPMLIAFFAAFALFTVFMTKRLKSTWKEPPIERPRVRTEATLERRARLFGQVHGHHRLHSPIDN